MPTDSKASAAVAQSTVFNEKRRKCDRVYPRDHVVKNHDQREACEPCRIDERCAQSWDRVAVQYSTRLDQRYAPVMPDLEVGNADSPTG